MTLTEWQRTLHEHFEALRRRRSAISGDRPIFALEHGLDAGQRLDLEAEVRAHIAQSPPRTEHALPWIVYATELGYRY